LVTLAEVKAWLGVTTGDHDTVLEIIIASVESSVLNYTEAVFELTEVAEVLDGTIADQIVTKHSPIDSVTALYFDVDPQGNNGRLVDAATYQVRSEVIVLQDHYTTRGRSRIRVDYKYGYDGVPGDVKLATLQACEAEFRRKGRKSIGLGGRSKKDESETLKGDHKAWDEKTGLPKEVVSKLNPYRVFEFPTPPAQRNL